MNVEDLRNYCLAIKNAEECTPFGEDVMVYKIMNKMFAFFSLSPRGAEYFVVLKCDPEKTVELRETYQGITKGYYAGDNLMWNSVYIQKDVPDKLIIELIGHSVEEVVKKLPPKKREEYRALNSRALISPVASRYADRGDEEIARIVKLLRLFSAIFTG